MKVSEISKGIFRKAFYITICCICKHFQITCISWINTVCASVYKADAFDPAKPEYRVRYWDKEGNYTDTNVQINGVDPRNAT